MLLAQGIYLGASRSSSMGPPHGADQQFSSERERRSGWVDAVIFFERLSVFADFLRCSFFYFFWFRARRIHFLFFEGMERCSFFYFLFFSSRPKYGF